MNFTTEIKEDQILLKENDETLCWLKETLSQGSVLVELGGKLRGDTAYVFLDELNALASVKMDITLDLSQVTYLSNAHIQAFLVVQRSLDQKEKELVLKSLSPQAKAALDSVGASVLFDVR